MTAPNCQKYTDDEGAAAMRQTAGNLNAAMRLLGVSEATHHRRRLRRIAEEYGDDQRSDHEPEAPNRFRRLVEVTRREPLPFSELCDKLDLSPAKCRKLISDAEAAGVRVQVAHNHVGIEASVPGADVVPVGVAPAVGDAYRCAVITDTHAGSRYAMREQLRDFVNYAYDEGCREVLHCGDMLDGNYRHGVFELTHSGIDDQARDAGETLPQRDGLHYHAITGNHDFTFAEKTGMSVGRHIEAVWRNELGRQDLTFHGDRSAYLRVGGVVVHLWHPKKSPGYALSYQLQKQVEKYTSLKPQILLVGHWHIYCAIAVRGVEAIGVPCFQGGGSAFGKSLGGNPSIGGLILEWRTTEHGTMRDFAIRPRRYYERETIVEVRNAMNGEEVPERVSRPVAVPTKRQPARWSACSGGAS